MHQEIIDFFSKIIQEIKEFLQKSSIERSKSFESSKNLNPHISILPQL